MPAFHQIPPFLHKAFYNTAVMSNNIRVYHITQHHETGAAQAWSDWLEGGVLTGAKNLQLVFQKDRARWAFMQVIPAWNKKPRETPPPHPRN